MADDFRVLLVNVSLVGDNSGTGVTLKNLFEGIPQAQILQLSLQLEPADHPDSLVDTLFLDTQSLAWYMLARRIQGALLRRPPHVSKPLSAAREDTVPYTIGRASMKARIRSTLSGWLDMLPLKLSHDVTDRIRVFDPSVIYTAGSSIRVHRTANRLARDFHVPIVLHLMDDWPRTVYTSTLPARIPRMVLLGSLARTNRLSITNFAISEPLAAKYSAKFGKPYSILMNPATTIVDSVRVRTRPPVEFLYAGSLALGRAESLHAIAREISLINEPGAAAHLTVYAPDSQLAEDLVTSFRELGCTVSGYLPRVELARRYADADVLVHVESFAPLYAEFAGLSLSTKIPEYMGAGKPILAYLPASHHGSEYIRLRQCGVVVNDADQLHDSMCSIVSDTALRERLANQGLQAAKAEHLTSVARTKLIRALSDASASDAHMAC